MEINRDSGVTMSSEDDLKTKLPIKAKENNLVGVRALAQKLKALQRNSFRKKYGNLLGLLDLEIQSSLITAFSQYYDPPVRAFTFQDFQLVPTIEEFEQILDLPMEGKLPYKYVDHHTSIPTLSGIIKIHPREIESALVYKKGVRGFNSKFLESHLHQLANQEHWDTFMDVLALMLYGLMLFPTVEDLVDYAAIDAFVASRTRGENPVPAILADTYIALQLCYDMGKRKLMCCLPIFYVWFLSRLGEKGIHAQCPVEEVMQRKSEFRKTTNWGEFLSKLTQDKVKWHPSWQKRTSIIYYCGNHPNVPLIGTKGCVNYNPILAQRQFGYPIRGSPTAAALTTLLAYHKQGDAADTLRQIRNAWKRVIRMERDSRAWGIDRDIPYQQWVTDRAKQVKLPFRRVSTPPRNTESSRDVESDEVKKLKKEVARLKERNAEMANDLQSLRHDYADLNRYNEEKKKAYEGLIQQQRSERDYTYRIKQDLAAANKELAMRVEERNMALSAERQWKNLYADIKKDKQEAMGKLQELQLQVNSLERQMEETITICGEKIGEERMRLMAAEEKHQAVVTSLSDHLDQQEKNVAHWRKNFSQLAALANGAIADIPKMLRDIDAVTFRDPPQEIQNFLDHCKWLIEQMKIFIARARD